MTILGIETSCDETSAAIVSKSPKDTKVKVISNIVASSLALHAKTGGIVPERAAREQVKLIIPVIKKALEDSNLYLPSSKNHLLSSTIYRPNIDAIAVTVGPGLIGSLLVGIETAKVLAYAWKKPIIPVNHLVGHIYANFVGKTQKLTTDIQFPALSLIVSGGHTDLVLIKNHGNTKLLGGTRDDAAGEAFDKIGRLLGLPYPGGPAIEKASERGDASRFTFPRPMIYSKDFDFSFSGLKSAVSRHVILNKVKNPGDPSALPQDDIDRSNLCASVQQAIIDVLVSKTLNAAQKYKAKSILLGGGVAANQSLREKLKVKCQMLNVEFFAPPKNLCTDNGAMIASAAFFNYQEVPWRNLTANPELYFLV